MSEACHDLNKANHFGQANYAASKLGADGSVSGIDISNGMIEKKEGSYMTLEEAKESWINEDHYPIGQYPHPVSEASPELLAQARRDYDAEMEGRNTDKGVWNNTTLYYVYGRKPGGA